METSLEDICLSNSPSYNCFGEGLLEENQNEIKSPKNIKGFLPHPVFFILFLISISVTTQPQQPQGTGQGAEKEWKCPLTKWALNVG